jgi:hypothetical protein
VLWSLEPLLWVRQWVGPSLQLKELKSPLVQQLLAALMPAWFRPSILALPLRKIRKRTTRLRITELLPLVGA